MFVRTHDHHNVVELSGIDEGETKSKKQAIGDVKTATTSMVTATTATASECSRVSTKNVIHFVSKNSTQNEISTVSMRQLKFYF